LAGVSRYEASLQYLQRYYKLVILSNVDRESFAGSNRRLGVAFDAICTAQDIGSYKPDPRNFAYLINTMAGIGVLKRNILHTAQSLHHDHEPGSGGVGDRLDRSAASIGGVGGDGAACWDAAV